MLSGRSNDGDGDAGAELHFYHIWQMDKSHIAAQQAVVYDVHQQQMPDWTLTPCLSFCSKVRHHTGCRGWFSSDGCWLRSNTCSLRQKITITRIVMLFSLGMGGLQKFSETAKKENVAKWNISTRPMTLKLFIHHGHVYTWTMLKKKKKTITFGYSITFSIYFLWKKNKYDFHILKKKIFLFCKQGTIDANVTSLTLTCQLNFQPLL